jgi:preprotein translocase subunit SecD
MKTTTLSLILVLLTSACVSNAQSSVTNAKPQFVIMAGDVSAAPVIMPTNSTEGIVDVHFSGRARVEFAKFWQEHLDQQVQILFNKKVIGEPVINGRIGTGYAIYLHFPTVAEAKRTADLLTKG